MIMTCPIQTPNDTKGGAWSWYRHDNTIQGLAAMEANDSVMDPNETFLDQPVGIGATSHDGILILRNLQLNDSGVYVSQLNLGHDTTPGYIKLIVNGKLLM